MSAAIPAIPGNATLHPRLSPAIEDAKRLYDLACCDHQKLVESGIDEFTLLWKAGDMVKAGNALIATPSCTPDDASLKIVMCLSDVAYVDDLSAIHLMNRAITALRSGSVTTARKLVDKALQGETDEAWAYEWLSDVSADLLCMEAQS